jgi:hypothetical protein
MIFQQNAVVAAIGSSAGLVMAVLGSRALASFLYETSPRDPWVLLGSVAALTAISSAASAGGSGERVLSQWLQAEPRSGGPELAYDAKQLFRLLDV